MSQKPASRLFLRFFILVVFGMFLFGALTTNSSNAALDCPPEAYENCYDGSLRVLDPETCQCVCSPHSGLCIKPGNPAGEVDLTTCTCRDCVDFPNCP